MIYFRHRLSSNFFATYITLQEFIFVAQTRRVALTWDLLHLSTLTQRFFHAHFAVLADRFNNLFLHWIVDDGYYQRICHVLLWWVALPHVLVKLTNYLRAHRIWHFRNSWYDCRRQFGRHIALLLSGPPKEVCRRVTVAVSNKKIWQHSIWTCLVNGLGGIWTRNLGSSAIVF